MIRESFGKNVICQGLTHFSVHDIPPRETMSLFEDLKRKNMKQILVFLLLRKPFSIPFASE
jgi:hypothetical protein